MWNHNRNKKIVLIGGGGHCRSVLDTLIRTGQFSDIVITDHDAAPGTTVYGYPVAGGDERLPELFREGFTLACITVGSIKNTAKRRELYRMAQQYGFEFPAVTDPSAVVAPSASVGKGVYIGRRAVVNADACIGDFAIINTGAVIEHGCRIGAFTHAAVCSVVCGGADIGADVLIGANATIIQDVTVGRQSIAGAGSTVLADVPEHSVITGRWAGGHGAGRKGAGTAEQDEADINNSRGRCKP